MNPFDFAAEYPGHEGTLDRVRENIKQYPHKLRHQFVRFLENQPELRGTVSSAMYIGKLPL